MRKVKFIDTVHLPNLIEMRNIDLTYNNGKSFIIKDFDLLIEDKPNQGQFVVLLGKSGCGKSTILRLISGTQKPTNGTIKIHNEIITGNEKVGMVFQKYSSFPWLSVYDNIAIGLEINKVNKNEIHEKVMDMIKLMELEGHENKYAQYPILSGGQLQRVAIARSIICNPSILLMDEPFGALDIYTRIKMQDLLAKIWMNLKITIVFVTHDIHEAVYLGDDVYIMSNNPGCITESISIPFPLERKREIKRSKQFIDIVYSIEDKMLNS